MSVGLTEEQIGQIVDAYRLQMARYEAVARFVEQRLRRELRAAALPVLLSSRAKHPEISARSCAGARGTAIRATGTSP